MEPQGHLQSNQEEAQVPSWEEGFGGTGKLNNVKALHKQKLNKTKYSQNNPKTKFY